MVRFWLDCVAGGAERGGGLKADVEPLELELYFRLCNSVEEAAWYILASGIMGCNVIVDFSKCPASSLEGDAARGLAASSLQAHLKCRSVEFGCPGNDT